MTRRSLLGAVASLAAVVMAVLTVPAATTAAWTDGTSFWALSRVQPSEPGTGTGFGPLVPGANTTLTDIVWDFPAVNNEGNTCVDLRVTSTDGEPWSLSFLREQAPLWGGGTVWSVGGGAAAPTIEPGQPDRYVVRPSSASHAAETTLRLCTNSTVAPPPAEHRYTSTQSEPVVTGDQACFTITVQGVQDAAAYPFFYGWSHLIDLTRPTAVLGRVPTSVEVDHSRPDAGEYYSWFSRGDPNRLQLTSSAIGAIRGDQARVMGFCAR